MINKFFNRKTGVDGILFDSAREAARYKVLKEMQKRGEITALELQPKYELLPKFYYRGQCVRKVVYIADFSYLTKNGVIFKEIFREEETKDVDTSDEA